MQRSLIGVAVLLAVVGCDRPQSEHEIETGGDFRAGAGDGLGDEDAVGVDPAGCEEALWGDGAKTGTDLDLDSFGSSADLEIEPTMTTFASTDRGCNDLVAQTKWISDFGSHQGWSTSRPRVLADVNGDRKDDVVAFGGDGTYVSLSTGEGFAAKSKWVAAFGANVGGWNPSKHLRMLGDVNGDGRDDVVGFGNTGVYVSLSTGSAFTAISKWVSGFGSSPGYGWKVDKHPRVLADVNGDGRKDVVGFANAGTLVALSTGSSFAEPEVWTPNYGAHQGWSDQNETPRFMVDVNGDGLSDVVGFGSNGVSVALSNGQGFDPPETWASSFGTNTGWPDQVSHKRVLADVNGDRRADIVGFASASTYVALSTGDGFATPTIWTNAFSVAQGWGQSGQRRDLADMNNDGRADIIAIRDDGVWVSASLGDSFGEPGAQYGTYGAAQGWNDTTHPRTLADVNGDGAADVVGFGNTGVYVSRGACPERAVPLRFVQPSYCDDEDGPCPVNAHYSEVLSATERATNSWEGTGLAFWPQSLESHYMPTLAGDYAKLAVDDNGNPVTIQNDAMFEDVWEELARPFPQITANAYEADASRWKVVWLGLAAALYSDPNSVTTWLYSGRSTASFPNRGRYVRLNRNTDLVSSHTPSIGSTTLGHELGHYFGLAHVNGAPGPDPVASIGQNYVDHTLCDQWDLIYKPGTPPSFLSGNSPNCPHTGGFTRFNATTPFFAADASASMSLLVDGQSFGPGAAGATGVLRSTGRPHVAPWSFDYATNVMGGVPFDAPGTPDKESLEWRALGLVPRFVSDAQVGIVRDHISKSIAYTPNSNDLSLRDDGQLPAGVPSNRLTSLRGELAQADDDFFWFSNAATTYQESSFRYQRRDVVGVGYRPVSGDLDGDGTSDILWYHPKSGASVIWWFELGGDFDSVGGYSFEPGATPVVGDFDGNGIDDIFIYGPGSVPDTIYFGKGSRQFWGSPRNVGGRFEPIAADLDGDGDDDVVWYDATAGEATVWWSDSPGLQNAVGTDFEAGDTLTVGDGLPYRPVAGDFDDNQSDAIFWFRPGTGADLLWTAPLQSIEERTTAEGPQTAFDPMVGDYNADGRDDLFWDTPGLDADVIWEGEAVSPSADEWIPFSPEPRATMVFGHYTPVSGDFDGDGASDIFWYRS